MKGVNFADKANLSFYENFKNPEECIFISYKKENAEEAEKIGRYIMDKGIDIYLDVFDGNLQVASNDSNHEVITNCLENGLNKATYLLALVSEKTRSSWWVPYEIGYAKKSDAKIASLLLKNFNDEDIPSYLHTSQIIYGKESFDNFLAEIINEYPTLMIENTQFIKSKFQKKYILNGVLKEHK